ncbi:aminotransferase class I/II-fold pyridoxal phosphate-dependent enzyme, partial [bacterium]
MRFTRAIVYAKSPYLLWARRFYGTVPFDLAASGIPTVPRDLLGMPSSLENPAAWNELRAALAAYNDVRLDECVVALGTSHALWLAFASLVKPGDEVLLESPSYEPIELKARAFGATVVRFERAASEAYALSPARIAKAMTRKTRVVVVTNLH